MSKPNQPAAAPERPKSHMWKNVGYVMREAWKADRGIVGVMAVFAVCTAVLPFLGIFAPKLLIDELMGARRIPVLLGILIALAVLSIVIGFLQDYSQDRYHAKRTYFTLTLRKQLDEKSLRMKFQNTEDPEAMNQMEASRTAIMSWGEGMAAVPLELAMIAGSLASLIGYAGILITLHPLVLVILLLNVLLVLWLKNRAKQKELGILPQISEYSRRTEYLESTMSNFEYGKDIRLYHMGDWLTHRTWDIKKKRIALYYDLMNARFKPDGANGVFLFFREIAIYAYLIFKFVQGRMGIGDFTMYFATIAGFTDWMIRLMNDLVDLKGQAAYAEIYRAFLEREDDEPTEDPAPIPTGQPYEIRFENVTFRYPHGTQNIYTNLSLTVHPGEKLAIVGVNGAGKTTFVKLLARLYDPQQGRILLNGVDIRRFDREEYWKLFSVVFQEIKIFAFSVAENVALGKALQEDRLQKVLRQADIDKKINSLSHKTQTSLLKILDEEGIELSGGESQRLALARALYKDGPIVALDEPTAALDALAESAIYEGFNEMVQDKTAIYISHRLASTRFCDRIAFFENGRVVEYGTHDQLMALGQKYAEMFRLQAHYYQETNPQEGGDAQ